MLEVGGRLSRRFSRLAQRDVQIAGTAVLPHKVQRCCLRHGLEHAEIARDICWFAQRSSLTGMRDPFRPPDDPCAIGELAQWRYRGMVGGPVLNTLTVFTGWAKALVPAENA